MTRSHFEYATECIVGLLVYVILCIAEPFKD